MRRLIETSAGRMLIQATDYRRLGKTISVELFDDDGRLDTSELWSAKDDTRSPESFLLDIGCTESEANELAAQMFELSNLDGYMEKDDWGIWPVGLGLAAVVILAVVGIVALVLWVI